MCVIEALSHSHKCQMATLQVCFYEADTGNIAWTKKVVLISGFSRSSVIPGGADLFPWVLLYVFILVLPCVSQTTQYNHSKLMSFEKNREILQGKTKLLFKSFKMTVKECTECSLNIQEMFGPLFFIFYFFLCFSENSFCLCLLVLIVLEADGSFIDVNMFLRLLFTQLKIPNVLLKTFRKAFFLLLLLMVI